MSEDIVRQEDFGKDFGLIHEAVVTGRKVGATKEFWAKLAHDENLFRSVVAQVVPPKLTEDWLENILTREREAHRNFFGQEFDLASFQATLEKYSPERWQDLGLEPHFLPAVTMSQDANFPGWKTKPSDWYYEQVAARKILRRRNDTLIPDPEAFRLEGITILIDSRLKPQYKDGKQMFKNDNLLGFIIERLRQEDKIARYEHGPQTSRFGVSAKEWGEYIKFALAEVLGVEVSRVRLERAIEANVIPQLYPHMPRHKDGRTNTWVWYEEYFEGASLRVGGGRSGDGGLANVNFFGADDRWVYQSFRPLVVLGD